MFCLKIQTLLIQFSKFEHIVQEQYSISEIFKFKILLHTHRFEMLIVVC